MLSSKACVVYSIDVREKEKAFYRRKHMSHKGTGHKRSKVKNRCISHFGCGTYDTPIRR